jgi:hypothetical protein
MAFPENGHSRLYTGCTRQELSWIHAARVLELLCMCFIK